MRRPPRSRSASTVSWAWPCSPALAVSGTLWLPIVLHFLFDFSLVVQGQMNKTDERQGTVETGLSCCDLRPRHPVPFFVG